MVIFHSYVKLPEGRKDGMVRIGLLWFHEKTYGKNTGNPWGVDSGKATYWKETSATEQENWFDIGITTKNHEVPGTRTHVPISGIIPDTHTHT